MSPKFEQRRRIREEDPKERKRIHDARWVDRADIPTADTDVAETDISMSEIYKDKAQFEAYKKVGFNMKKAPFLEMVEKWENDKELTEGERYMREDVRMEFVTRMGIMKSCEKLLKPGILKGLRDADARVNRLVGELGEEWALDLIKPRLIQLVGEPDGTESLTDLWQSLRSFHGVYETRGFNKVYSRIENYREKYGITPQKWAEIQRGGSWWETEKRAFGEFQKTHGFLGRLWHAIPERWHASKIGFAGWREERNSQMQRLRESRSQAIDILERIMGPDFQEIIDKAIKSGDRTKTDEMVQKDEESDSKFARGLTTKQIENRAHKEWTQYQTDNPSKKPTLNNYNKWLEEEFKPAYESEADERGEGGWIVKMIVALFSIRLKEIKAPAGLS